MKNTPTTPDEVFLEDVESEDHLDTLSDDDGELIDLILGEETKRKSIFDDEVIMEGDE